MSKNIILYGPPGTGKTYNTIDKALSIIEGQPFLGTRQEAVKRYKKYVSEGRIVFTTFHQSLSYEDFVEGIKPVVVDGSISYSVQDGIFKELCKKATDTLEVEKTTDVEDILHQFEEALASLRTEAQQEGGVVINGDRLYCNAKGTFYFQPPSETRKDKGDPVGEKKIQAMRDCLKQYGGQPIPEKEFNRPEEGGRFSGNNKSSRVIFKEIEERMHRKNLGCGTYVLIIDEINRGNVANIFGELITLIEEDKRLNEPNELTAKLPYSKENFGVPSNLYIIGTMNTADRSVEALDAALRRRFTFEEMMPQYDLEALQTVVYGHSLSDILKTINSRVALLVDREHQVGHSYFLGINDEDEFKGVMFNKIVPLLQEYFYNDYEKLQLVVGKGFVKDETPDTTLFSIDLRDEELPEKVYKIDYNCDMQDAMTKMMAGR